MVIVPAAVAAGKILSEKFCNPAVSMTVMLSVLKFTVGVTSLSMMVKTCWIGVPMAKPPVTERILQVMVSLNSVAISSLISIVKLSPVDPIGTVNVNVRGAPAAAGVV